MSYGILVGINDEVALRPRIQDIHSEAPGRQIGFLEGHVAQLTQSISQLSLPPSQEEAKAKRWWFWRK